MENRRLQAIVGAVVLALSLILLVTLFLIARANFKKDYAYYDIHFNRPVSGLAKAGEVRFNGLLVGEVRDISMNPVKPGTVVVTVRVYASTPVTTDTVAELEAMGFTGVSYILLLDDDKDHKPGLPLVARDGEEYPVIPVRISGLRGRLSSSAEVLASTIQTLDAAARYMSDENIAKFSAVLSDIETESAEYVKKRDGYRNAIRAARQQMGELIRFVGNWDSMSEEALPGKIAELRKTAQNLEKLSADLDAAVTGKRARFSGFGAETLPEITAFATELRRATRAFNTTLERIEEDRVEMLFKPDPPTVELPEE
jgi:phospholipid/cholesterol/gamma-HCH transport system substrate-binding protein